MDHSSVGGSVSGGVVESVGHSVGHSVVECVELSGAGVVSGSHGASFGTENNFDAFLP